VKKNKIGNRAGANVSQNNVYNLVITGLTALSLFIDICTLINKFKAKTKSKAKA